MEAGGILKGAYPRGQDPEHLERGGPDTYQQREMCTINFTEKPFKMKQNFTKKAWKRSTRSTPKSVHVPLATPTLHMPLHHVKGTLIVVFFYGIFFLLNY